MFYENRKVITNYPAHSLEEAGTIQDTLPPPTVAILDPLSKEESLLGRERPNPLSTDIRACWVKKGGQELTRVGGVSS